MCSKVSCKSCGKPTWSGCGEHIEDALHDVPTIDRCQGHAAELAQPGFFGKLLGKN